MRALVWLGGREKRDQSRVNEANPGLAPSRSSGGSRAANADGAPRKHGAFHSSRTAKSQRARAPTSGWGLPRPGRVSCNRHARADVACHHAAGTDHRTIADGHAGQDDGAAADPDIAADPDRTPEFETLAPRNGIAGMVGGVDLHRGSDLGAVAD